MARAAKKKKQNNNEIKFDGQVPVFLLLVLVIGLALIVACVLTIMEPKLPGYLKLLLGLVALTTSALIIEAIKQTRSTLIVLGPSALEIKGPDGLKKYPWAKIESVRVVGPVGCFADDPLKPIEKRLGLGLFLKNGVEGRVDASDADAILAVGSQEEGERFVDAASHITKALRGRQRPGKSAPLAGRPKRTGRTEFAQRNVA